MKKYLLIILLPLLLCGCKKKAETFPFSGTVCGYLQCTLATASISEIDFGYVVSLTTPDSIGKDYNSGNNQTFHNCVIIYRTRYRYHDGDKISGTMYLDDKYSKAYCNYHYTLDLPEGVCYSLD